jgi:hypothetical protein
MFARVYEAPPDALRTVNYGRFNRATCLPSLRKKGSESRELTCVKAEDGFVAKMGYRIA